MKSPKKQRLKPGPKPKPIDEIGQTKSIRFKAAEWDLISRAAGDNGKPSEFVRKAALDKAKRELRK